MSRPTHNSDSSLFSNSLFVAQSLRLGGQAPQAMPQQPMQQQVLYSLPPQPMLKNQQLWGQHPQSFSSIPPFQRPPQLIQTLRPLLNQVSYNNQPMPMQQQPQIHYQWNILQQQQPQPQRFAESQIKSLPIEETRVIQSINQKQDGTHDYISLPKSEYDKILRNKNFNEVPNNCDLKYSLTINNFGNQVYDFHVIQRPEIRIIPFQTIQKTNDATAFFGTPHYFPNNIKLNSFNTIPGNSPTPSYESSIGAKLVGQIILFPSSPGSNLHH